MGAPVKNQAENGICKLFNLREHTFDVYDQYFFILKDSGINDEEGKKTNAGNPLTSGQTRLGHFYLSL